MLGPTPAPWTVRGATFALWGLAAASSAFWALKLGGATAPANAPLQSTRAVAAADPVAIARLLGSTQAAASAPAAGAVPTLASRLQLVGVVAGERSGGGAAVISVDGKPARPFRVGSAIDEGLVLQSVRGRSATIAAGMHGAPVLTLELPAVRPDQPALQVPGAAARTPTPPPANVDPDPAPPPASNATPRFAPPPGAPNVSGRLPPQPPPMTAPR
jgi:general secretion pathway protein C